MVDSVRGPKAPQRTPVFINVLQSKHLRELGRSIWRLGNLSKPERDATLKEAGVQMLKFGMVEGMFEGGPGTAIKHAPAELYAATRFAEALRMSGNSPQVIKAVLGKEATPEELSAIDHFFFNAGVSSVVGPLPAAIAGFGYDGLLQGVAKPIVELKQGQPASEVWRPALQNWSQVVNEDFRGALAGPIARAELGWKKKK